MLTEEKVVVSWGVVYSLSVREDALSTPTDEQTVTKTQRIHTSVVRGLVRLYLLPRFVSRLRVICGPFVLRVRRLSVS